MLEKSYYTPTHFCNGNYRRLQSLISHISSLVDGISLLMVNAEPIVEGK